METELLNEICQLIVRIGKYRLAWIGFAMPDSAKRVCPVAQAGFEDGYLNSLKIKYLKRDRDYWHINCFF